MLANERHEGNRPEVILREVGLGMAPDPHETLVVGGADRHHEAALYGKLPAVGLRHLGPTSSHEDHVKRRLFGPPQRAVYASHRPDVLKGFAISTKPKAAGSALTRSAIDQTSRR
jgi:hypothetical protein